MSGCPGCNRCGCGKALDRSTREIARHREDGLDCPIESEPWLLNPGLRNETIPPPSMFDARISGLVRLMLSHGTSMK